ncbi:MAG: hypothetical protein CML04_01740 [Pseudozobellia sp.]|nr:hypothetical protein [Pseudozobellia sp.]|tara:strand:+ start:289221 stop:290069 length:849 start_codon:yes stop_codon:yes gene_type:complete
MQRHIFKPIVIETYNSNFIECKPKPNFFFELVFIEKGNGLRMVDGLNIPFKKDQFFIHLPKERTFIKLQETSIVHFIKFQKTLFARKEGNGLSISEWFTKVDFILNSNKLKKETILKNSEETEKVKNLISILISEYSDERLCDDKNIKSLMVLLLNIVVRNIISNDSIKITENNNADIQHILNYIHINICSKEKLKIKEMANHFFISENYFGEYFLANTGINLKKYILNYKIQSARNRLVYSELTLSQIAFELGFTDLSHFNKTYKKICGISPSEERKNSNP